MISAFPPLHHKYKSQETQMKQTVFTSLFLTPEHRTEVRFLPGSPVRSSPGAEQVADPQLPVRALEQPALRWKDATGINKNHNTDRISHRHHVFSLESRPVGKGGFQQETSRSGRLQ